MVYVIKSNPEVYVTDEFQLRKAVYRIMKTMHTDCEVFVGDITNNAVYCDVLPNSGKIAYSDYIKFKKIPMFDVRTEI